MGLRIQGDAPEGALEEIVQHIAGTYRLGTADLFFADTSQEDLRAAAPYGIFLSGAEDALKDGVLASAKPIGWRYIIFGRRLAEGVESFVPLATAEVSLTGQFRSISRGPSTAGTANILGWAEKLPEIQASDYDLRYLKISGLSIMAVWLLGTRPGDHDYVIPVEPTERLEVGHQYPVDEFIVKCREAAVQRGPAEP
jgi:hypothetical protein